MTATAEFTLDGEQVAVFSRSLGILLPPEEAREVYEALGALLEPDVHAMDQYFHACSDCHRHVHFSEVWDCPTCENLICADCRAAHEAACWPALVSESVAEEVSDGV